jgi:hypothetical protein
MADDKKADFIDIPNQVKVEAATSRGRIIYPNIAKPDTVGKYQTGKFGTQILLLPADIGPLKEKIAKCIIDTFGPTDLKQCSMPLKNGDAYAAAATKPGTRDYAKGFAIFTTKGKFAPHCVGPQRDPNDPKKWLPIDPTVFYSGCFGRLSVTFAPILRNVSVMTPNGLQSMQVRGVTAYFRSAQFLGDGERIGGAGGNEAGASAFEDDEHTKAAMAQAAAAPSATAAGSGEGFF